MVWIVGEWVDGLGHGLGGWYYVCVCCERIICVGRRYGYLCIVIHAHVTLSLLYSVQSCCTLSISAS